MSLTAWAGTTMFMETNLVLNWEKCHFMVKEGIVLGHKILGEVKQVDQDKLQFIAKIPSPIPIKCVRSLFFNR